MIHTNRIVTVGEQESIIDRPIVLYRGDREVEIEFTLVGNEFTFSKEGNVIKSVNASHGQLVLNTPSGEHMFSELAECHEGKVVFVVTKEMIDEFVEMGFYSFQIRLYDSAEMKSRVTIPPVMNGFDIRNPIAAEDETNAVDQGIVDYARIFKDQSNEELPTFDWKDNYVKTEWVHHDVITENKLNKIEDALYSINANIKETDMRVFNTLDQVKKDADTYVKEHIAEVEADVEEFERNLNADVQKFKIDTNAAMTTHKNEVENRLQSVERSTAVVVDIEKFGIKSTAVVVDIEKFGIKSIDFNHKPPYSTSEWEMAYDNMEAFKAALAYYSEQGIGTVIFPKGHYPVCYRNPSGSPFYDNWGWEIIIPSNMNVDLSGSTIKVIFDSLNRNPYDKSTNNPWQLNGSVISFKGSKNSSIRNGEIIGDRYERAYNAQTTNAGSLSEQWQEQTYGIRVTQSSEYITIENMVIHGFMGDAIHGKEEAIEGMISGSTFYPGYIVDGSLKTDITTAYTTNMIDISRFKEKRILITGSGYTYVPNFKYEIFDVSFWDEAGNFISTESAEYKDEIVCPANTTHIRLTIYNEDAGLSELSKTYRVSGYQAQFLTVRNCEIYDNNRGGMSNLPHNTIVEQCSFYENGGGTKKGWVVFPDTTRYHINCEDQMPRAVTIRNCDFNGSFNCLLLSSKFILVEGNTFRNGSTNAVSCHYFKDAIVKNNVFLNIGGVNIYPRKHEGLRKCMINSNILEGKSAFVSIYDPDCIVVSNDNMIISEKVSDIVDVSNSNVRIIPARIPKHESAKISGVIKNLTLDVIANRHSTTFYEINMNERSGGNYLNLNDLFVRRAFTVYDSIIDNGIVQLQDASDGAVNALVNSRINTKAFRMYYYNNANDNKVIAIDNCVISNKNYIDDKMFKISVNATPQSDKTLNCNITITNSVIELQNTNVKTLFYVNGTASGIVNVNISLINCTIKNMTSNTIQKNNTDTHVNLTFNDDGCTYIGNFS